MATIWFGQRRVVYRPDPTRVPPSSEGLSGVDEVILASPDGERLIAWYAAAPVPSAGKPPALTVLYFHGNGAGLADRAIRIHILQAAGFGIFMLAYRGYSGSSGRPSEAANVADARLAYAWLRGRGVTPERLVLFGESIGTGVAVQVAAAEPAAGLILDSPFTSLVDVGRKHFPWLPVGLLLRDRYMSIDQIAKIRMPLLIVHGERDQIVPFALGRRLFEAAVEPKRHVAFPNIGHLVPFDGPGWPVIRAFLDEVGARVPSGAGR